MKPRVSNPRICRGRSSSIGVVCGKDMRVGITDRRLQSTSTIDDPSTSEGSIQVGFIAISASSTTTSRFTSSSRRKQENFRARHSKIDINKSVHAQPTGQKNVCVADTRDGNSELISTIP